MKDEKDDFFLNNLNTEVFDEESKLLAIEKDKMKENYINSKFEYMKKKLEEK
jgi:hypothetical protein